MPIKVSGTEWFAERIWDAEEDQKAILACEQQQHELARAVTACFHCSVASVVRVGDRFAIGYKVVCRHTGKEFWIWGPDRTMSNSEIHASFTQQVAIQLGTDC